MSGISPYSSLGLGGLLCTPEWFANLGLLGLALGTRQPWKKKKKEQGSPIFHGTLPLSKALNNPRDVWQIASFVANGRALTHAHTSPEPRRLLTRTLISRRACKAAGKREKKEGMQARQGKQDQALGIQLVTGWSIPPSPRHGPRLRSATSSSSPPTTPPEDLCTFVATVTAQVAVRYPLGIARLEGNTTDEPHFQRTRTQSRDATQNAETRLWNVHILQPPSPPHPSHPDQ
jgi:hypothetical protein